MKKIFSLLALFTLVFNTTGVTSAAINVSQTPTNISAINSAKKTIIIEGEKLNKTSKGKKYLRSIDMFAETAERDRLKQIQNRSQYVLTTGSYSGDILSVVKYLHAKTTLQLLQIPENVTDTNPEPASPVTTIPNLKEITQNEEVKANEAIMMLQKNIYNSISESTKSIETSIRNATNVSEKGAFEMDIEANHESFGYIKYKIEADNYESHQNGLDSETKTGDMNILFNIKNPEQEEMKLDLVTNFEAIQKEGDLYMLLKKLKVNEQKGIEDMKILIEKIQNSIDQKTYIKFTDLTQKQIYEIFKNTTSESFMKNFDALNTKTMFDVKGKVDEKYVLEINKDFCMFMNSLPTTNDVDCETDLQDIVNEMREIGTIYLETNTNGTHSITFNGKEGDSIINFATSYTANELLTFQFSVEAPDNGSLDIKYNRNKNMHFKFAETYTGIINLDINLDENNAPTSGELEIKMNDTDIKGTYKNNHLSINLNTKSLFHTITGTTELDFRNSIPTDGDIQFKVTYEDDYTEKKTEFESNIKIQNKKISGTTNIPDVMKIIHSGRIDENIFMFNNDITFGKKFEELFDGSSIKKARDTGRKSDIHNISTVIEMHKSDYGAYPTPKEFEEKRSDYFVTSYLTEEGYIEDPRGNIEINNCKFGYIYEVDKEKVQYKLSSCLESTDEKYTVGDFSDSFSVDTTYNISGYTNWEKVENKIKKTNLKGMLNIDIDTRRNKNNIIVNGELTNNNDTILSILAKNISTREYNTSVEIKKPIKVIEMQEVMKDLYNY